METNKWIKSSECESNTCVEVMKCDSGKCVEVLHRAATDMVYVNKLSFTTDEWRVFVAGVKAGEFDV